MVLPEAAGVAHSQRSAVRETRCCFGGTVPLAPLVFSELFCSCERGRGRQVVAAVPARRVRGSEAQRESALPFASLIAGRQLRPAVPVALYWVFAPAGGSSVQSRPPGGVRFRSVRTRGCISEQYCSLKEQTADSFGLPLLNALSAEHMQVPKLSNTGL